MKINYPLPDKNSFLRNCKDFVERPEEISEEGTIEPWVADNWTLVDDTTWEINIKDNVTFSNGKKVNAAAVKACFERLIEKNERAASGLKMTDLEFDGRLTDNSGGRFALAMDSLALYTDAGYKLSAGIAIVMMFLALAELGYTLIIFCAGHPIEGWTTMMFVLTLGFAGLFAVLTIIIKYLSLLVDLVFKKQNYLIESIEKIQK